MGTSLSGNNKKAIFEDLTVTGSLKVCEGFNPNDENYGRFYDESLGDYTSPDSEYGFQYGTPPFQQGTTIDCDGIKTDGQIVLDDSLHGIVMRAYEGNYHQIRIDQGELIIDGEYLGLIDDSEEYPLKTPYTLNEFRIKKAKLPDGTIGIPYSFTFQAEEGKVPYIWAIIGGLPPLGLSFDSLTGELFGTPQEQGVSQINISATDENNRYTQEIFFLTVFS